MLEAIKQRQSIRKYQNTPVETEKIILFRSSNECTNCKKYSGMEICCYTIVKLK